MDREQLKVALQVLIEMLGACNTMTLALITGAPPQLVHELMTELQAEGFVTREEVRPSPGAAPVAKYGLH